MRSPALPGGAVFRHRAVLCGYGRSDVYAERPLQFGRGLFDQYDGADEVLCVLPAGGGRTGGECFRLGTNW